MSALPCQCCGAPTRVVETFPDVDEVHRLRVCTSCGTKFLTCEQEVPTGLITELRRFKLMKTRARKNDACY